MNRFLLGTTALISAAAFTAPALAADKIQLELHGFHVGGISYSDVDAIQEYLPSGAIDPIFLDSSNANEFNFASDSEVHFRGSTTLDNGLKISFRAELELEDDEDAWENHNDHDLIDEVYVQVDGGFGRVQFGQNDGAMYQQHIAAPNAFVGHGVNQPDVHLDPFAPFLDVNIGQINTYGSLSDDHIKLTYFTPSMNGFQFGLSYTPNPCKNAPGYAGCISEDFDRNHTEVSGSFTTNLDNISIGLSAGYGQGEGASVGGDDPTEWTLGGEIGFAGLTVGGSYRDVSLDTNWDETHWDAGVSFKSGPWDISVTYGAMEVEGISVGALLLLAREEESWAGGVTYLYGPGMQIGVGVQTMENNGVAFTESVIEGHELEGTSFFVENVISF